MSSWIDHAVVAVLVIVSAAYAIYSLGPRSLRARIRKHVFRREQTVGGEAGCGSCGDCGSLDSAREGTSTSQGEARISLASVRKELKVAERSR